MAAKLVLLSFCFMLTSNISAKTKEHHLHKNEIGAAFSPVYFLNENEFTYGMHLHYVRNIPNSKFGVGLGYERIFATHKHNTYGIEAIYRPIEPLSFKLSPGLAFEESSSRGIFALHFETAYEFEISDFHVGPMLEFACDKEDQHMSLGIHVGYAF